jgi:hypothetical protein
MFVCACTFAYDQQFVVIPNVDFVRRETASTSGKNWKVQTRLLVREGAPHQQTWNCQKITKERMGKIGCAWYKDGLADSNLTYNISLQYTWIN